MPLEEYIFCPFFLPAETGIFPITYETVEPAFGDWADIKKLSETYYLMCDVMVNHVSKRSKEFLDYLEKGEASPFADMFLDYEQFWGEGRRMNGISTCSTGERMESHTRALSGQMERL